MAYFLSPIGNDQQCSANGAPLSGGKIYTYLAGTSTPAPTYTDSTSGTQQANPIILNSLGLPASPIWMTGGIVLKFVIKDSADVLIRTIDGVSGINDTSSTASEWTDSGLTPTYISATSFSLAGDQTANFQVNRRVRTKNTAGYIYGRITASVYASTITTVTVLNDSGAIDSGLSLVSYGFLSYSPSSLPYGIYQSVGDSSQSISKIQSISGVVGSNALTISASATILDFRNASGGVTSSGAITTVSGTPANLVVPSSATLGTVNNTQSRLVVLALNNAGTIELAVVNIAGGNDLTETGLISTTAISAASTANNVFYSTTARTNVAYRVLGYIESTQATAGTWANSPSTIQGYGGQALAAMSSLGYGQTWQNVTGSRALSTTYYNTTGKPITVLMQVIAGAGASFSNIVANIGGFSLPAIRAVGDSVVGGHVSYLIPAGMSYSIASTPDAGTSTIRSWSELR